MWIIKIVETDGAVAERRCFRWVDALRVVREALGRGAAVFVD